MSSFDHTLTSKDLARAFGTDPGQFSNAFQEMMAVKDFSYQILSIQERDQVILEILKKLDSDSFSKVGKTRQGIWTEAWSEYLDDFVSSHYALDALNPKFMKPNQVVRWNSEFVKPSNSKFELDFFDTFRFWLFENSLKNIENVYEFGCGSAFNLVALARLYPDIRIYGMDWAYPSVQLVNEIAKRYNLAMSGHLFDFFAPNADLSIQPNSAVLTMCALEQVGENFQPFLKFLLQQRPQLCIHMEPICELYDETNLVDYLAIRYHQQRGYLRGFLTHLKSLESQGQVVIEKVKRLGFGSLFHEGYSLVIWHPV